MATKTEYDGYTQYTRQTSGRCPPVLAQPPIGVTYISRSSNGGDGKGSSAVPKCNAYTARFGNIETAGVSITFTRRSLTSVGCDTDISKPYPMAEEYNLAAPLVNAPGPPVAKAELLTKLRSKVFEELHTFQGGVALAEFAETARMVISPFRTAMRHTNRVLTSYINASKAITGKSSRPTKRSLSKRQLAQLSKEARDHYLQWQLGILPLMSDIESGTKAFYQNVTGNQPSVYVKRVSFKAISQDYPASTSFQNRSYSNFGYRLANTVTSSSSQKAYGYLVHTVSLTGASSSRRNLGFDFESFVPTIWEAIPFSFVADYVTNIGDVIQALSVDTQQIYGGAYTVKSRTKSISAPQQIPVYARAQSGLFDMGPFNAQLSGGSATSTSDFFSRSIITGQDFLMSPKVRFEKPSIRQIVNVGALLSAFSHPTLGVSERDQALVRRFFKP